LRPLTWLMPRPSVRKAYEALVRNLLLSAENDTSPSEEVRTDKGSVDLNREDVAFWQMTAILRVVSPELEQHVASERPNIARLATMTDGATWQQVNFLNGKKRAITQDDLDEYVQLTPPPDPASSKAALANTSGVERVRLLLSMAAGVKESDPAKAAGMLTEATDAVAKIENPIRQLTFLTTIVEAGEDISQATVVRGALQTAFPLGDQQLRKAIDSDPSLEHGLPGVIDQLGRMTTAGMYIDPDFTTSLIDQLSTPLAKALLLVSAADVQFANVANRKSTRKVAPIKR